MESRFIDEPFDEEERQLMEAVENSPDVRFPEEEERRIKSSLQEAAKVISIRMQGDDLRGIREMAKAAGMPYQTLINSIIHRYVTGGISFKVPVWGRPDFIFHGPAGLAGFCVLGGTGERERGGGINFFLKKKY